MPSDRPSDYRHHFVTHNQKLHRTLLPHRVELYIRIKNSSQSLGISEHQSEHNHSTNNGDGGKYIGSSIECPIRCLRDAQGLSFELRTQFLRCANRLIGTEWFGNEDRQGAKYILRASQDGQSGPAIQSNKGEPSAGDALMRELERPEKHLPMPSEKNHLSTPSRPETPQASVLSQNGNRPNADQNINIHGVFGSESPGQRTAPPDLNRHDTVVQDSPPSDYASLCRNVREKLKKDWSGAPGAEASLESRPNDSPA
ncbi:hypothetical protein P691DRAFT_768351 [Macrolepiota fuliginosa MF-IS2]|uniref:Uncharacterized protein n=1 Tax=Macrolepiota fuliginosa MF-IS2 TaxID=1400762 RepID=A0A9P5WYF5_9AGAR|nr:hypothetical protein P691DRAFT_768351 [Macrolepiota fuliginosa MF-IS2]